MTEGTEYSLKIDAYTPETLPMARLAEYMSDLARLLGEEKAVHFVRIDPGSAVLVHQVEREADPKVRERVARARVGGGPGDALRAIRNINRRLKEDNATGVLKVQTGAEIIKFPGREEVDAIQGSITEQGTLDGVVMRLGGTQDTVGVLIQARDGKTSACWAKRNIAKQLAPFLFGQEIRVYGTGTWFRMFEKWQLERFYIHQFKVLDESPLEEVVQRLRAVEGSGWPSIKSPFKELERIRETGARA